MAKGWSVPRGKRISSSTPISVANSASRFGSGGAAVFYGRVKFDLEVERVFKEKGSRLRSRAMELLSRTEKAGCSILDAHDRLQSALLDMDRLLKGWVTPKPAIGPSARQVHANLAPAVIEEGRRRIASLPPLPAEWQPEDPQQRAMYREPRRS